jgi:hypothetical protein
MLERVNRPFLIFLKMNLNNSLIKLTAFFNKLLKLLLPLSSRLTVTRYYFWSQHSICWRYIQNVTDILNMLGEDALLVLVSLIIILIFFKKD